MSAGADAKGLRPIRLVFELARADNPRLFDELSQFPKGAKRVNRLRVLAYDGLLAQHGVFVLSSVQGSGQVRVAKGQDIQVAAVTNGLFEPGLAE